MTNAPRPKSFSDSFHAQIDKIWHHIAGIYAYDFQSSEMSLGNVNNALSIFISFDISYKRSMYTNGNILSEHIFTFPLIQINYIKRKTFLL